MINRLYEVEVMTMHNGSMFAVQNLRAVRRLSPLLATNLATATATAIYFSIDPFVANANP